MSKVMYNQKLQTDQVLFNFPDVQNGALCARHGLHMGGTWGFALLGPDIMMTGGASNNPPQATCTGWDLAWSGTSRPTLTFGQDVTYKKWIKGHLVNGEWGGSGTSWNNLAPFTSQANANHKTVEGFIKTFLTKSRSYDQFTTPVPASWYGVEYLVECSLDPFAHTSMNVSTNLYAYAPAFVKVRWRAVEIAKPTNVATHLIPGQLPSLPRSPVSKTNLPFTVTPPKALNGATCLPSGNTTGGPVHASGITLVTAQQNGFDGEIEIHQC